MGLISRKCLLEGGAYSDLSVNGAALIRGQCLFETQHLFKELWKGKNDNALKKLHKIDNRLSYSINFDSAVKLWWLILPISGKFLKLKLH